MKRSFCTLSLLVLGTMLVYGLLSGFLSRARHVAEWARNKGSQNANLTLFLPFAKRFLTKAEAGGFISSDGRSAVDRACQPILDDAWKVVDAAQQFENPELREFNRIFRWLNRGLPARGESTLCHLRKGLGIESFDDLPLRKAVDYFGKRVEIEVTSPTERWARDSDYENKAVVTVGGKTSLVLYWSGKNGHSRGFLIEGVHGIYPESHHQAGYLMWDRSEIEQVIKYYGAEFENAYLESVGGNGAPADKAIYGELRYNRLTSAFHLQSTVMEPQAKKDDAQFGCYRWHARGTKGDLVLIAQTDESHQISGHGRNTSFRDASEMDAVWLRDERQTSATVGKLDVPLFQEWVVPGVEEYPFRKSCNDLYAAGISGGAFSETDNDVRFDAEPNDLFSLNLDRHSF